MSVRARRIVEVLRSRATSDGLYQAVQLEDKSYALIRGGSPVQRRQVLAFEPGNGAEIHTYAEVRHLEEDWAMAMDDIENSDLMLEGRPIAQSMEE